MVNRIDLKVRPEQLTVVGGGETRDATDFETGQAVLRNGRQVKRVPGCQVLLDGVPLDSFALETTADVTDLGPGGVLAAQGEVSVSIRADAKPGFNGGSPRGSLAGKVFIETLTPVASLAELVAQASRRQPKGE
ncbi:MAG: hypothetical protein ACK5LO_05185 [Leucobacter sp.]